MIPAAFDYMDPTNLSEVIDILKERGNDAKLMAGGMSLLPLLKLRFVEPKIIVDLWKVPGLSYIKDMGQYLAIGAMTTHYEIEASELIKAKCPILIEAAKVIGSPQVRNLGTIGGNLVHADPAADYPPVLVALGKGTSVKVQGPSGERTIPLEKFFVGVFETQLNPNEVLTEIQVPVQKKKTGYAYLKMSRRGSDPGIVNVAIIARQSGSGVLEDMSVILGSVTNTPVHAYKTEELLRGKRIDAINLDEAVEMAADGLEPTSTVQADAQYRLDVTPVRVKQALISSFSLMIH